MAALYTGVFVARVVATPAGSPAGLYVVVPRLNQSGVMGPCETLGLWTVDTDSTTPSPTVTYAIPAAPPRFLVNQRVLVATVGGVKDSVIVLGPIVTPTV